MSGDWDWTHAHHNNAGQIIDANGQPFLAATGDLGDTIVSGSSGISNSGNIGAVPASPISVAGSNLTINVTYDQSGGLPSGFVNAINYVVTYYETLFTTATPTTVNIDVGYGEIGGQALDSGALGESESFLAGYTYSTIKSALASSDPSAAASLPSSQPVSGSMWISTAEAKALNLTLSQPATDLDGYAGFSASLPFAYDPTNRAVAGKYDFVGVVEHEFTEIMGRIDLFNATLSDGVTTIPHTYSLLDMYHYTSNGVHTYTGTTSNYFSVDGGHTNLVAFNAIAGGDLGDWASSAGNDSFLAFSPSGVADVVSAADVTTMNALGYQSVVLSPVTIEAIGVTSLVQQGDFFFLDPSGGGTGPEVKMSGAPIGASQIGGWAAIGAEAVSGGYEVAFHYPGSTNYTVWNLDNSGTFLSDTIGAVAGTSTTLENLETSFHQDLNGDGVIGQPAPPTPPSSTTIESFGATALVQQGDFYFLNPVASGTGPEVKMGGAPIGVSQIGGWAAIGAEAVSGGYDVAFHYPGSTNYTVWNLDNSGTFVSDTIGAVVGTSLTLENLETSFHQDLNGDAHIGPPGSPPPPSSTTIESFGVTALVQQGDFFFLNPVGGGTGPEVKMNGTPIGASQIGGWGAIGAEAVSGGYEMAFHYPGSTNYTVWNLDSSANFVSDTIGAVAGTSLTLENFETSFHQDLNGDNTIGVVAGATGAQSGGASSHDNTPDASLIGLADPHHDHA